MKTLLATAAALAATSATPSAASPLGVMADVGVPDGANASIVLRPASVIRVHAGVGHNAISRGVRAGLTLRPLPFWVSPTLSVDYGRYPEGDANPLARMIAGDPELHASTLERIGYSYANAHVGLELGRRRFAFYLRAGVSRVAGNLRNLSSISEDGATSITFAEDPRATVWTPSARLGLVLFL